MLEMANANPKGIDGVRMSWNVWPQTKVEASKCIIPLATSISPICPHPDIPYTLLHCKTCASVLNPSPPRSAPYVTSVTISLLTIPWSPIPISPVNSTLNAPPINTLSPVFVFVLDTCMIEEEMGYVKSALRYVACHWLVAQECPCWLRFIWDSDSGSWIGLLRHVQGFDFSGKGNDKVRGTTSFPLLFFLILIFF